MATAVEAAPSELSPRVSVTPLRSTAAASRLALAALVRRDLLVLRKHFLEFVLRTLIQPFLLVFVFLYVFPTIGQGIGGAGPDRSAAESAFATVLVPGVVAISIMFQGVQSVALSLAQEFGYTREIEDRVQAPCPIWLVAVAKILSGATQGLISAVIVFPIAAVVHAGGVEAHLTFHWAIICTLVPLACLGFTCLGLLLGTTFEPRNIGLMFGFIILPITFLTLRYLLPVDQARTGPDRRLPLAAGPRAREPSHLHHRGDAGRLHPLLAPAAVRDLPGVDCLLCGLPRARAPELQAEGALLASLCSSHRRSPAAFEWIPFNVSSFSRCSGATWSRSWEKL
jgi:ABC-2 type transport system permease protein